jgi:hypothetical protein
MVTRLRNNILHPHIKSEVLLMSVMPCLFFKDTNITFQVFIALPIKLRSFRSSTLIG